MKFHITADDEDYLDFLMYYQLNAKGQKRIIAMSKWGTPAFTLLIWAVLLFYYFGFDVVSFAVTLLMAAYLVYSVVTFESRLRKRQRRIMEDFKKDGRLPYEKEADVEFSENEILYSAENISQKVPYSDVRYVWRDEKHIYIIVAAMMGIILPLSCLDGKEDEIISFVEEKRK